MSYIKVFKMSLIFFGLLNFVCNIYADSAGCTDINTACTTVPKVTCRDANFRIVCQHYCGCPEPSTLSQMSYTREEIATTTTKPLTTETTQPLTTTTQMVAESTTSTKPLTTETTQPLTTITTTTQMVAESTTTKPLTTETTQPLTTITTTTQMVAESTTTKPLTTETTQPLTTITTTTQMVAESTTTKPLTTETTQPLTTTTTTTQMVAESTTMEVFTVNHTSAVDSGECKDIYTDCSLVMQTAGRHPCNIGYVRDGCKQTCGLCSGRSSENITILQETSTSSNLQTTKQLNYIPMTSPTVTSISQTTTPSSDSSTVTETNLPKISIFSKDVGYFSGLTEITRIPAPHEIQCTRYCLKEQMCVFFSFHAENGCILYQRENSVMKAIDCLKENIFCCSMENVKHAN